jgi:hypothetical protein
MHAFCPVFHQATVLLATKRNVASRGVSPEEGDGDAELAAAQYKHSARVTPKAILAQKFRISQNVGNSSHINYWYLQSVPMGWTSYA